MAQLSIIRRAWGVSGLLGSAFGVAGWQDDARAWAQWAKMNPELAGALMGAGGIMLATWLVWEIGAVVKRHRAAHAPVERSPSVQINLEPGATYQDFRGTFDEFHVHLDGRGEIVSSIPVVIHHQGGEEAAAVKESFETTLIGPDGEVKAVRRSDDERPK